MGATPTSCRLAFEWHGVELVGSLHLPAGPGPHPAVVMAQGSGPADRDADGFFDPIRHTFLDRGLATFSFDKPGCGESSGDWQQYGLVGRADQLLIAIGTVRSTAAIDAGRVGVWGHSQGGWLVQQLAAQGDDLDLAFAIANSAPSISVSEQILHDCEQTMQRRGHDRPDVDDALALARALHEAAVEGVDFATVSHRLLAPASRQPWYDDFPSVVDAGDWQHVTQLLVEPHEPLSQLRRVTCPFLAVYGGLDALLPTWRCAEESGRALQDAPSTDATVVVFPGGDHRVQDAATTTFADGYLDLLGDWAAARVR